MKTKTVLTVALTACLTGCVGNSGYAQRVAAAQAAQDAQIDRMDMFYKQLYKDNPERYKTAMLGYLATLPTVASTVPLYGPGYAGGYSGGSGNSYGTPSPQLYIKPEPGVRSFGGVTYTPRATCFSSSSGLACY